MKTTLVALLMIAATASAQAQTVPKIRGDGETPQMDIVRTPRTPTGRNHGRAKAWARIDRHGDVVRCWNCVLAGTYRVAPGLYFVTFNAKVHRRPRSATAIAQVGDIRGTTIDVLDSAVDPRRLVVSVFNIPAWIIDDPEIARQYPDTAFSVIIY